MLWLGDSTARRAATTLYAILNETTSSISNETNSTTTQTRRGGIVDQRKLHLPRTSLDIWSVIDVNKGRVTEPCIKYNNSLFPPWLCREMPSSPLHSTVPSKDFIYVSRNCLKHVEELAKAEASGESNLLENIDLVVVGMGIWESMRARDCRESNTNRTEDDLIRDTVHAVAKLQSSQTAIVWRTSGFHQGDPRSIKVLKQNQMVMDLIDEFNHHYQAEMKMLSNLSYVDWGGAIEPRSFGNERITGDLKPHYGLEPRLVLSQMITNNLRDRGVV
jgi:hypothetical protein